MTSGRSGGSGTSESKLYHLQYSSLRHVIVKIDFAIYDFAAQT